MLIYLWVKSEPYGLVSLKTHKEFGIKGTALGKFVLCFTEHVVLKKIEQGCCWCSTTVLTIAECSLCAGTGAWWFPPVISRHLPHDPGSPEVGRGWGVERIPYRVSSPEPSVLIACRNFGQNGEDLESRLCSTAMAFPPKIPRQWNEKHKDLQISWAPQIPQPTHILFI